MYMQITSEVFGQLVQEAFHFLESEHDFRFVEQRPFKCYYHKPTGAISVVHDEGQSLLLWVTLFPAGDDRPGLELEDVLGVIDPEKYRSFRQMIANNPEELTALLSQCAAAIREIGPDRILSDPKLLTLARRRQHERCLAYSRDKGTG